MKIFLAILVAIAVSSAGRGLRAESQPQCPAPLLYVGNGRMPVDALGVGLEVGSPVTFEARVQRAPAGSDSGAVVATVTEASPEPSCQHPGYRVRFLEPLEVDARYELVVDYTCEPPYVVPPYGNSGTVRQEFIAVAPFELPESLPAPVVGALTAENHNGCATDARAYTLPMEPGPALAGNGDAAAEPEWQGALSPELHVDGACVSAPLFVDCPGETGDALELRWALRIPHAGVGVAGEPVVITLDCDEAVDVSGCDSEPSAAPNANGGEASRGGDGGCSASGRPQGGTWGWVFGLLWGIRSHRAQRRGFGWQRTRA